MAANDETALHPPLLPSIKQPRPSRALASAAYRLCPKCDMSCRRRVAGLLAGYLLPCEAKSLATVGGKPLLVDRKAAANARSDPRGPHGAAGSSGTRRGRPSRRRAEAAAKQAGRRDRLRERVERGSQGLVAGTAFGRDVADTDRSAYFSRRIWECTISGVVGLGGDGQSQRSTFTATAAQDGRSLRAFYAHAAAGDVAKEHITTGAARGFVADKFEARCDKMCCALLCMAQRSLSWRQTCEKAAAAAAAGGPATKNDCDGSGGSGGRVLRVASVGGGPGNDAYGAMLFAALMRGKQHQRCWWWDRVAATVFDFSTSWRPFCEAAGSAAAVRASAEALLPLVAPDFTLRFQEANLRAPVGAPVNAALLQAAADTDLYLFSHVVRESRACEHELLPELLRRCRPGAAFVFLDMQVSDLDRVRALVEELVRTSTPELAIIRLGGSQEFPFFGLATIKTEGRER